MIISKEDFIDRVIETLKNTDVEDFELDNDGQIIIYTGHFLNDDLEIENGPEIEEGPFDSDEDDYSYDEDDFSDDYYS